MRFFWIVILIFSLSLLAGCTPSVLCDGIAYNFHLLYNGKDLAVNESLNLLVKNNTQFLKNCSVMKYIEFNLEFNHPKMGRLLSKYSVKSYNVSFSCDILDFNTIIYEREGKYYMPLLSLGPCDKENVYFIDTREVNPVGGWYYTKYSFEYEVIESNLNNFDFCVKFDKRISGENEFNEDRCNFVQAKIIKWHNVDEAIAFCDKIKWIPTKIDCYETVVTAAVFIKDDMGASEEEVRKAIERGTKICNRLNESVPDDDPYKYQIYWCYKELEYG